MKKLVCGLICLFFLIGPVYAVDIPAMKGRVTDQTQTLSAKQVSASAKVLRKVHGASVVALIVKDLQDETLEDFAQAVFQKWGLGERANNNGLLILIVTGSKQLRLQPGYGLEGTIPDSLARELGSKMVPYLAKNDFVGAFRTAANEISVLVKAEDGVQASGEKSMNPVVIFWILLVSVPLVLILWAAWPRKKKTEDEVPERFRDKQENHSGTGLASGSNETRSSSLDNFATGAVIGAILGNLGHTSESALGMGSSRDDSNDYQGGGGESGGAGASVSWSSSDSDGGSDSGGGSDD